MNGLNDEEVIISRKLYGSNDIDIKNNNKFFNLFISALSDPIIKIMLIALVIRVVFMFSNFNWFETLGMLISILLSTLISSLSEYASNKEFYKLQKEYQSIYVRVKRNGIIKSIKSTEVVKDDLILISSGEKIVADGIIVSGSLGIDESSISGEAIECEKLINDKVFSGTLCLSGEAVMQVSAVGSKTSYGSLIKEINEVNDSTPLKEKLTVLAKVISKIGFAGALIASLSYVFNVLFVSNDFNMTIIISLLTDFKYMSDLIIKAVTLDVTILIVCVPEGLPMLISLVLSSNMKRMLNHNVLVRKLVGLETSGCMNVLLTDKTGTLTKGKLEVIGVLLPNGNIINEVNKLSNNIINSLIYNNESMYVDDKIINGNQTDQAILKFTGNVKKEINVSEFIKFNSKNKYSKVTLSNKDFYIKGASEIVIDKCLYYYIDNDKFIIKNKTDLYNLVYKYTSKGIRVIATSMNNILLGFILIKDEIRNEAYDTIKNIKNAGINVIMLTGDDKNTATSIASELDIVDSNSIVLTHTEMCNMSDDEILEKIDQIKVIARMLPSDKSRMSGLLKSRGYVVGMTGDGINDAPALKKADVGFALGSGSVLAKEASDIVILDDNIKSIENAISYGRTIFKSIRKFIVFQLTMNFCALSLSVIGPLIGITSPVTIMQMLWINMIMDTLASIAYSSEYPLKRYLSEKPTKRSEAILNKYMYNSIIFNSLYCSILLVLFLKTNTFHSFIRTDSNYYMTSFFSLFIFFSIFNAFNTRTEKVNILSDIFKNKIFIIIMLFIFICQIILIYKGGSLFRTYGLNINELLFTTILAFTIIPFDMIRKYIFRKINV